MAASTSHPSGFWGICRVHSRWHWSALTFLLRSVVLTRWSTSRAGTFWTSGLTVGPPGPACYQVTQIAVYAPISSFETMQTLLSRNLSPGSLLFTWKICSNVLWDGKDLGDGSIWGFVILVFVLPNEILYRASVHEIEENGGFLPPFTSPAHLATPRHPIL